MAGKGRRKGEDAFVLALAGGATVRAAAKKSAIGERTGHRWLQDPVFRERVDEVRDAMFERGVRRLANGAAAAAVTLHRLLKAKSEAIRLSAARALLELCFKARDWGDTVGRIEALERNSKQAPNSLR
jgi:hypothetical protein